MKQPVEPIDTEGWTGELVPGLDVSELLAACEEQAGAKLLQGGRHRVWLTPDQLFVVKRFGLQGGWKDRVDAKRGTKAQRSFLHAQHLIEAGVGTPTPLGYAEKWLDGRLTDSFYVSAFVPGLRHWRVRMKEALNYKVYTDEFVDLLEPVAKAIRAMHQAGFLHHDLGNQNIELTDSLEVYFIDLNRGSIQQELSEDQCAKDLGRIWVPSGLLGAFLSMYWGRKPPQSFRDGVIRAQHRFDRWQQARWLRHPIRTWKRRNDERSDPRDWWLWDRRSSQATVMLRHAERRKLQRWSDWASVLAQALGLAPGVLGRYRKLKSEAFSEKRSMTGRVGMALEVADIPWDEQVEFLKELEAGTAEPIPVSVRIGHHLGAGKWCDVVGKVRDLAQTRSVTVVLMQDRTAVIEPERWVAFLEEIVGALHQYVSRFQIGHTPNRAKWGVWTVAEYQSLVAPVAALQEKYPGVAFIGPGGIDFELHYLPSYLKAFPEGIKLAGLAHLLYVDRRGAPENEQGGYATVEKAALLKAIAQTSSKVEDEVIVTEVNWPLAGTGTWSPVDAVYQSPGAKGSSVGVTEEEYGWYMLRYLALTICSGMVDQVYWWRLVAHGFGLIDERDPNGWRKRPAFEMLRWFFQTLGEATFVQKLPTAQGIWALEFEKEERVITMLWGNKTEEKIDRLEPFREVRDCTGQMLAGRTFSDGPVYGFR